jgi:hypothetical protein
MNGNELANLLEADSWYKLVTREEIATTLRQQQAEIEALKGDGKVCARCGAIAYDPVITQTAKTLTDEEIADFEWAIKNVLNFSQSEKVVGLDNVIRAILRKAQEK